MLAKPGYPAISPHAPKKTGTWHIYTVESRRGGQKLLNAPHIMLILPAILINKHCSPKHLEFHACARVPKLMTTITYY